MTATRLEAAAEAMLLGGGEGSKMFFAGSGNATMIGGSGADLFAVVNGSAGGAITGRSATAFA